MTTDHGRMGDGGAERAVDARLDDLDDALSYIVHELRNPIAAVQGFAVTLRDAMDRSDRDVMEMSARAIERGAKNLGELVNSFSDIRSLDVDATALNLNDHLVSELLEDVIAGAEHLTRHHDLSVTMEDDVLLRVDAGRIKQILTNLLSNAAKFAPRETGIELSVTRKGDVLEICVSDQGPGIPAERVHELFQKFSRLGSTANGTGIGLYISRGIARAHGGDLLLGAAEDQRGCRFVLQLPIHGDKTEDSLAERERHLPR